MGSKTCTERLQRQAHLTELVEVCAVDRGYGYAMLMARGYVHQAIVGQQFKRSVDWNQIQAQLFGEMFLING